MAKVALFGMSPKERSNKRRMETKIAELLRFSAELRDKLAGHEEEAKEILRQAMFDFGSHRQTCAVFDPDQEDAICDCGFDDLTAGLFEKYKEEEEKVKIQDAENRGEMVTEELRTMTAEEIQENARRGITFPPGTRVEEIRDSASGQLLRATEITQSPDGEFERRGGIVRLTRPSPEPERPEEPDNIVE